jgi:hypothetical protein
MGNNQVPTTSNNFPLHPRKKRLDKINIPDTDFIKPDIIYSQYLSFIFFQKGRLKPAYKKPPRRIRKFHD